MGTSTSNPGQKGGTPLVPTWLDDDSTSNEDTNNPQILGDSNRFRIPRSDFTRYINSGGSNSGRLNSASSNYVKSALGGSHNAMMRLGGARVSTARLMSVLNNFTNHGISETSRRFGFADLIGKSASEVFLHIVDFVCPNGGSEEEGIARDSYIEAVISSPELQSKNIENLTSDEFLAFSKIYMSNIVKQRLLNDIGTKSISLPEDITKAETIQQQITDFISGAVSDAVAKLGVEVTKMDSNQTQAIVDSIYKCTYDIMASMEE